MLKHAAVIMLFLSSAGWGLTWLPAKALLDMGLASQHFILLAFGAGAVALLPFLWWQRTQWLPHKKLLVAIAMVGGFAYVSFQTAIARGDTVRVMILFYLLPIWSVLGGRIFLQERIDLRRIVAVVMCIGGAALTLQLSPGALLSAFDWIDVLAIFSGLAFVGNNLLFRLSVAIASDENVVAIPTNEKGVAIPLGETAEPIPLGSKVAAMYCGCALQIALSLLLFPTHATLPHNAAIPLAILYMALSGSRY
jgi:drug/metabolite transporter (DMT)-like permease